MPPARLFFEPQKTVAISSSVEKASRRLAPVVATITTARIAKSIARIAKRVLIESRCQIPAAIPALNAAYTTTSTEPRSTTAVMRGWRSSHAADHGRII